MRPLGTAAVSLLVVLLLLPGAALAASPAETVREAFTAANRALSDPALEDQPLERFNAVLRVAARVFAFRDAAEQALGLEWRLRTPREKDEFTGLFANLLQRSFVLALATRARLDGGVALRPLTESVDAHGAQVSTGVPSRDGNTMRLEFRMLRRDERWMIRDVVIDGISVVENYRAQIRRVLASGTYADVVARMRARVADLSGVVVLAPDVEPAPTAPALDADNPVLLASVVDAKTAAPLPIKSPPAAVVRPGATASADDRAAAVPLVATAAPRAIETSRGAIGDPAARPAVTASAVPPAAAGDAPWRPRPPADPRLARSSPDAHARAAVAPAPPRVAGRKAAPGAYWVQVGAFKDREAARRLAAQLGRKKLAVQVGGGDHAAGLTRVRVGPLPDRARAVAVVRDLERQGFKPFIHAPETTARN